MPSDDIGEAARLLVPVLRRLSSRRVGRPLRRAVRHLDQALIDAGAREDALVQAVSELRSFLSLVQLENDSVPYEDVARVLAILTSQREPSVPRLDGSTAIPTAPSEGERADAVGSSSIREPSVVPEPVLAPHVIETIDAPGSTALVESAPSIAFTGHSRTQASIESHFSAVELLYSRRHSAVAELATSWAALAAIDQRLGKLVRGFRWIGRPVARRILASPGKGLDVPRRFAAASILLASGEEDARDAVFSALLAAEDPAGEILALRFAGDRVSSEHLASLLPRVERGAVRAALLSLLGDRHWLRPTLLVQLLQDVDDEVAVRGAEMVVWLGRPAQLRASVEGSAAISSQSPARRGALVFAAAALGSTHALRDVRTAIDSGVDVTLHHVHALAAVGGAADADRLASLACARTALSPLAALAAGHLGCPAALRRLELCSTGALVEHAIHATCGSSSLAAVGDGRRLLRGELWSVAGALACLTDPDELLVSRYWRALELAVRTGTSVGAMLDCAAPIRVQDSVVGRLRESLSSNGISMLAGRWS